MATQYVDLPSGLRAMDPRTDAGVPRPVAQQICNAAAAELERLTAVVGKAHHAITAVLHQMDSGEASDIIDGDIAQAANEAGPFGPGTVGRQEADARRDLIWCREQLRSLLRQVAPDCPICKVKRVIVTPEGQCPGCGTQLLEAP